MCKEQIYHCDNTSGWLPSSFVCIRVWGENNIKEEVYYETESRMRYTMDRHAHIMPA